MKRIFSIFIVSLLMLTTAFAQENNSNTRIPQMVNFSATVRDANNAVLANAPIFVRLTFLAGGQDGTPTCQSWYETTTNASGFMNILINRNVVSVGVGSIDFEEINWNDGDYWMKVEYKVSSGQPWIELGTLELSSSFYAFVAGTSEVAEKLDGFDADFSGAEDGYALVYSAASHKWETCQIANLGDMLIPTNMSDMNNDVNFIVTEADPTVPDWAKTETKPTYDFEEIQDTPDMSGYLTAETDPTVPDWAKAENKPAYNYSEIQNTPTNITTFNNNAGYVVTESQTLANVITNGNSAGGQQIKNVTDPTDVQDAATKAYVDAMLSAVRTYLLDSITYASTHGYLYGHEYVDLGLPSGTKWATCNVGATSPEGYGDYFAWGETTPKDDYSSSTYTYSDNPEVLPAEHDAASVNWGSGWRMPTEEEFRELMNLCDWEWITTGTIGFLITSPYNGNSIFLPAAGFYLGTIYHIGSDVSQNETEGIDYWSSSIHSSSGSAWSIWFRNPFPGSRYYGYSVRPVCQ